MATCTVLRKRFFAVCFLGIRGNVPEPGIAFLKLEIVGVFFDALGVREPRPATHDQKAAQRFMFPAAGSRLRQGFRSLVYSSSVRLFFSDIFTTLISTRSKGLRWSVNSKCFRMQLRHKLNTNLNCISKWLNTGFGPLSLKICI